MKNKGVEEIAEKRERERKAISQKFMAIFERTPNELRENQVLTSCKASLNKERTKGKSK